eukprot:COSAG03_NODE_13895_length_484_cov_1.903896_1_plen_98_part_01
MGPELLQLGALRLFFLSAVASLSPPLENLGLQSYWSAARQDNAALAVAASQAAALGDGYIAAAPDGWVGNADVARPAPDALPLVTYWSAAFNDSMQAA